jgi:DNA polymerase-3 subunit alpha
MLEERRRRPYASFTDFARRLDPRLVNKRALDALIAAGAFDSLGRNRATLTGATERVLAGEARLREEAELGQSSLFGGSSSEEGPPSDDFPDLPELPLDDRLKGEKDTLGFYVTGHPLTRFADEIERFAEAKIAELGSRIEQSVRIAGVLGSLKKQKIKKGVNEGKTMLKAALEDTSGTIPVAIFASLYEKVQSWVREDLPVLAVATVREAGGALELTVQEISPLEGIRERRARELAIRVNLAFADENVLARLQERLRSHPGTTPVSIRLIRPGEFEATLRTADSMRIAPSARLTSEIQALAGEGSVEYVF